MEKIVKNEFKPEFNLEIASTPNCNMACTYCFEGEELQSKLKQTDENINNIINRMDDLLTDPNFFLEYKGICVNFWGGEPTINFEWNRKLIETIRKQDWSYLVTFFIYSNGYDFKKVSKHLDLFTKEELLYNKLRLQISWDGIEGGRIDHRGKQTLNIIERNIKNIALIYPELHLRIKATIQPLELLKLKSIWLKFYDLDRYIRLRSPSARTLVNYSPTLNYVDDFQITDNYLQKLNEIFIEISRLEYTYFIEYQSHLFTWFESNTPLDFINKRKTNCSAGIHMMAFDIEGNASVCHGSLYSPLKNDFIKFHGINIGNITSVKFKEKFYETRNELKTVHSRFDESCRDCTATMCYKCPIVNVEQSIKGKEITNLREEEKPSGYLENTNIVDSFQDRDPRHCQIYKVFGMVDRALFKLKENNGLFNIRKDNGFNK